MSRLGSSEEKFITCKLLVEIYLKVYHSEYMNIYYFTMDSFILTIYIYMVTILNFCIVYFVLSHMETGYNVKFSCKTKQL